MSNNQVSELVNCTEAQQTTRKRVLGAPKWLITPGAWVEHMKERRNPEVKEANRAERLRKIDAGIKATCFRCPTGKKTALGKCLLTNTSCEDLEIAGIRSKVVSHDFSKI